MSYAMEKEDAGLDLRALGKCEPGYWDGGGERQAQASLPLSSPPDATTSYSHQRYGELLKEISVKIEYLAKSKGDEYAHGDDRLDNFRRGAANVGVPMEVVWQIYTQKHWDAITTYVKDISEGHTRARSESIRGRAMDIIVYLTLFIAMVEEREGK